MCRSSGAEFCIVVSPPPPRLFREGGVLIQTSSEWSEQLSEHTLEPESYNNPFGQELIKSLMSSDISTFGSKKSSKTFFAGLILFFSETSNRFLLWSIQPYLSFVYILPLCGKGFYRTYFCIPYMGQKRSIHPHRWSNLQTNGNYSRKVCRIVSPVA